MRLDGFGLFVNDMPKMVRFYRDVLGFEITEGENAVSAARSAKNLRTGETVTIAACKIPAFKAGKALKNAVNK